MTKRRAYGDGGLYWNERRQRWIAPVTVGYDGRGKRMVKTGSGRTKTEAKQKLREQLRDHEDGLALGRDDYTVGHAVEGLAGLRSGGRSSHNNEVPDLLRQALIPLLGARKLRDLTAREVDAWLFETVEVAEHGDASASRSCLNRAVKRAMARPGQAESGRTDGGTDWPGRSAVEVADAQAGGRCADEDSDRQATHIQRGVAADWWPNRGASGAALGACAPRGGGVVAAARGGVAVRTSRGGTKTKRSRRTLALPERCIEALCRQRAQQAADRLSAGERWRETGLVFTTSVGTKMLAGNVRRDFRRALALVPGLNPSEWTPRELRHSFVSLLSDAGVPLEQISQLVGHSGTTVTELVYRRQLRPVIQTGAIVMDQLSAGTVDKQIDKQD